MNRKNVPPSGGGQRKILALHDLAGAGRSSLVPILSAISAMGHQCVPVPTAVYSSHLGLPGWHGSDLTAAMRPALAQYEALGLRFDAVYTGFLSSAEQLDIVAEAAERLCAGLAIVDPVLGDNGRLYSSATPALCARMGGLCGKADVITPNCTEAAVLLGMEPCAAPRDSAEACDWARQLRERYGAAAVLTGFSPRAGELAVVCCAENGPQLLHHPRIDAYYPGTGDLFAAVLTGSLVHGETLPQAAGRAAEFVRLCIEDTERQGAERLHGVRFEPLLYRLSPHFVRYGGEPPGTGIRGPL